MQNNMDKNCQLCSCALYEAAPVLNFGDIVVGSNIGCLKTLTLRYLRCKKCGLVQNNQACDKNILYGNDYNFFSSMSFSYSEYCKKIAHSLKSSYLREISSILEVGGNDGTLLSCFDNNTTHLVNVDPFHKAVEHISDPRIKVFNDFFSHALVKANRSLKNFSAVLAFNVISHVENLRDFIFGLDLSLSRDGLLVIEMVDYNKILLEKRFEYFYHGVNNIITPDQLCKFLSPEYELLSSNCGYDPYSVCLVFRKISNDLQIKGGDFLISDDFTSCGNISQVFNDWIDRLDSFFSGFEYGTIAGYAANSKCATVLSLSTVSHGVIDCVFDRNLAKNGAKIGSSQCIIKKFPSVEVNKFKHLLLFSDGIYDEVSAELRKIGYCGEIVTLKGL